MSAKKHPRRRQKFIERPLQMRLAASFAGVALLCLTVQALLFLQELLRTAARLPGETQAFQTLIPGVLLRVLCISLVLLLPAVLLVAVRATFPVAGPVFAMKRYLRRIAAGEELPPLRIRKEDELQELCHLINAALAATRAGAPSSAAPQELAEVPVEASRAA